jgi:hypothetical protein
MDCQENRLDRGRSMGSVGLAAIPELREPATTLEKFAAALFR